MARSDLIGLHIRSELEEYTHRCKSGVSGMHEAIEGVLVTVTHVPLSVQRRLGSGP